MTILFNSISSLFVVPILTEFFLFFDSIIYAVAEGIYKIFEATMQINFNSISEPLSYIVERLMTLVTVFMLFRLAIIFIGYITDPDKLSDKKETSGSKLVINIVVVLVMLSLIYSNFLFGLLSDIQIIFFGNKSAEFQVLDEFGMRPTDDNIIERIFLSNTNKDESEVSDGRTLCVYALNSFLYLWDHEASEKESAEAKKFVVLARDWKKESPAQEWLDKLENISAKVRSILSGNFKNLAAKSPSTLFYALATDDDVSFLELNGLDTSWSYLEYFPIISTAVGIYLITTFFSYAIDLIVRAIKLFLLQLFSPIAAVAYLDPKGKEKAVKYIKTYFQIYIEIFIKAGIIFLTVIMIKFVMFEFFRDPNFVKNLEIGWFGLQIFRVLLIIALLRFAKVAPKLLEDLLGIKLDEGRKISLGKILGGVAGATLGLGFGVATGGRAGFGSALYQGITGGYDAAKAGYKASNFGDFVKNQISTNTAIAARSHQIDRIGGLRNYMQGKFDKFTGKSMTLQDRIDDYSSFDSNIDSFVTTHRDELSKMNTDDLNNKFKFSEMARPINLKKGIKLGSEDNYVNNHSKVVGAREAEEMFKRQLEDNKGINGKLEQADIDKLNKLRSNTLLAEKEARDEYSKISNIVMKDTIENGDKTAVKSKSRVAYEKIIREKPQNAKINFVETEEVEENGEIKEVKYKNNIKEIRKENANIIEDAYNRLKKLQGEK